MPEARIATVKVLIIRRIAVGKPVGHDEVNYILIRHALKVSFRVQRGVNGKRNCGFAVGSDNLQFVISRFCIWRNLNINKEIRPFVVHTHIARPQSRAVGRYPRTAQIRAAHQDAHRIYRVAGPPRRRLDF